jgi:hypothetical protein
VTGACAHLSGILVDSLVTQQSHRQARLRQRFTEVGDDLGGGVPEAVEDAHHAGVYVVGVGGSARGRVSSQLEEVVALLQRQTQFACRAALLVMVVPAPDPRAAAAVGGR